MNIQALATIVEDMNKALYKALPDVEGIHLRYYDSSFWMIAWNNLILINTMEDSLEHLYIAPSVRADYTEQDVKNLLAERFAKAYAEKLVDKLKENPNEPF